MATHGYIHHIPGRLRVRSGRIERNQARAAEAVGFLRSKPGVHSATANPLTGSLTVHYNTALTTGDAVFGALKEAGWLAPGRTPLPPPPQPTPAVRFGSPVVDFGSEAGVKFARTVALYALERVAERSLAALIAAVL